MEKVDTLIMDKTGTLTEGKPRLTNVTPVDGFAEPDLLLLVATLEKSSEHPVAAAIVEGAERRGLMPGSADGFQSFPGLGISGSVSGHEVLVGNTAFLESRGIKTTSLTAQGELLRQQGQTVVLAAVAGKAGGVIAVADPIKASTPEAVDLLRKSGLRLAMLTGDNRTTAASIARKLDMRDEEFEAGVLPERKFETVRKLQGEGHIVAMA